MEVTHTRSTSSAKGRPKNLGFFVGICVLEEIRDLSSETLKNLTMVNLRVNIIKKTSPIDFLFKINKGILKFNRNRFTLVFTLVIWFEKIYKLPFFEAHQKLKSNCWFVRSRDSLSMTTSR